MFGLDRFKGAEELELDADTIDRVEAVAEEAARAEVAELEVEVKELSEEVQEVVDYADEQQEAVEELQEEVAGMESMLNSGNFHGGAFNSMYNRAAKLNAKLEGKEIRAFEGSESLGNAADAKLAAFSGMESMMDTIKGWGKKAAEIIKAIYNAVINFFVGLFNKAEGLKRRADALDKRLSATEKVKETVKLGGWNVWFDYAKSGKLEPVMMEANKTIDDRLTAMAELAAKPTTVAAFATAYKALVSAVRNYGRGKEGGTDTKKFIAQDAGMRAMVSYYDGEIKDEKGVSKAASSTRVAIVKAPDVKALTTGTVPAKLDKAGLKSAIASVQSAATALKTSKVAQKFGKAQRDQVIGMINALKGDTEEAAKEAKEKIAVCKASASIGATITKASTSAIGSAASAVLDGVAAHL